jgi:hypothetical protein
MLVSCRTRAHEHVRRAARETLCVTCRGLTGKCRIERMSETPATNPYAVSLEALERQSHVPVEERIEEVPDGSNSDSAWAWEEERRQARLAGGA